MSLQGSVSGLDRRCVSLRRSKLLRPFLSGFGSLERERVRPRALLERDLFEPVVFDPCGE